MKIKLKDDAYDIKAILRESLLSVIEELSVDEKIELFNEALIAEGDDRIYPLSPSNINRIFKGYDPYMVIGELQAYRHFRINDQFIFYDHEMGVYSFNYDEFEDLFDNEKICENLVYSDFSIEHFLDLLHIEYVGCAGDEIIINVNECNLDEYHPLYYLLVKQFECKGLDYVIDVSNSINDVRTQYLGENFTIHKMKYFNDLTYDIDNLDLITSLDNDFNTCDAYFVEYNDYSIISSFDTINDFDCGFIEGVAEVFILHMNALEILKEIGLNVEEMEG